MNSDERQQAENWEQPTRDGASAMEHDPDLLIVDVKGFEGPLDLLLELARQHKIDLAQISILALADQYLAFIDQAKTMRLDIAADYLVMAAWLAYLKSRLLIPVPQSADGDSPQDMAAHLAFKLQRLQAMRESAANILSLPQLNTDVFARGAPEPLVIEKNRIYSDTLVDLLKAYTNRRAQKLAHQSYTIKKQQVWSIKEARDALVRIIGLNEEWDALDNWLTKYLTTPEMRRSVTASSFTASLELAREGVIELRQEHAFQPIYLRRREQAA